MIPQLAYVENLLQKSWLKNSLITGDGNFGQSHFTTLTQFIILHQV